MNTSEDIFDRTLINSRVLNAPIDLVWEAWSNPKHIIEWWGPNGFRNTFHQFEMKVGGVWEFIMHGPDGTEYPNFISFVEVIKPTKLIFIHGRILIHFM